MDSTIDANRAYWRSRRGLLELDLILPRFARVAYGDLSPAQRAAYHALLDCDDRDIWAWMQGGAVPGDAALGDVIDAIRAFVDRGHM